MPQILDCGATVATTGDQPGDLITKIGQIEFNGLLMGDGTPYRVGTKIAGWSSQPSMDDASTPKPNGDGAWPGQLLAQARVVEFTNGQIVAADLATVAECIDVLNRYVKRTDGERPLVVNTGGKMRMVYGRVVEREVPEPRERIFGVNELAVQWKCTDPLRYSVDSHQVTLSPQHLVGGLTYPLTYPLDYGDVRGGVATVTNAGDADTPVVLEFTGPMPTPQVRNRSNNMGLRFTLSLASSDVLRVDTRDGSVILNGVTDRSDTLVRGSTPPSAWRLEPGDNKILFGGGHGSLAMTWADAYL